MTIEVVVVGVVEVPLVEMLHTLIDDLFLLEGVGGLLHHDTAEAHGVILQAQGSSGDHLVHVAGDP